MVTYSFIFLYTPLSRLNFAGYICVLELACFITHIYLLLSYVLSAISTSTNYDCNMILYIACDAGTFLTNPGEKLLNRNFRLP